MVFETKEEVLEKLLEQEKPNCPHCKEEMNLWEVPPVNVGDGLGWGEPYLYICFNDECPMYKEGWDNIDIFGWMGYPMQIKIDFLCRDSILAAPIALDLVLLMDLAKRAEKSGIQEWLSFYFKNPIVPEGLYPEHDLFIQLAKMKNNLRYLMGEELITHLGVEYYPNST